MVKHTQTIRREIADDCLSVFDHFVGLAFKRLKDSDVYSEPYQTSKLELTSE